jgi:hypothetical protein
MPLNAISPCDCSIIPVSPQEAYAVFPTIGEELQSAIDEAESLSDPHVLCPNCGRTFTTGEVGRK